MRSSRLFTNQPLQALQTITLDSQQSHYITHVLRLKKNQPLILFDGITPYDYPAIIINSGKKVVLFIEKRLKNINESPLNTRVFQALSKKEHIDLTIQKCTELGVSSIIIFNSVHTQNLLKPNRLEKKQCHWKRIAQSACEQCGRSIVPTITFHPNLSIALTEHLATLQLMLDFEGSSILELLDHKKLNSIDILLGAEGGLSKEEIQFAQDNNFKKARLGPRVLRTETAAIAAMSLIQLLSGDLK